MSKAEPRKVLVTGASGFIGSHLIEELVAKGDDVSCLVLPDDERTWIKDLNLKYIIGDLRDKKTLAKAVADVQYIYHLAGGELGNGNGEQIHDVNFTGTQNIVDACTENGIPLKRFLLVSSVAVAGPTQPHEIRCDVNICKPISSYGKSKLMAEQYLRSINTQFPYTIVRLPLVYGPRSFRGLYQAFKFINHGITLDFGVAQTVVLFVKDAARGIMLAAEHPATLYNTYFLGNEKIFDTNEISQTIKNEMVKSTVTIKVPYPLLYSIAFGCGVYAKITGKSPALRKQDVESYLKHRYWRYDTSKAKKDFDFEPHYSLSEGIHITAEWYLRHGYL